MESYVSADYWSCNYGGKVHDIIFHCKTTCSQVDSVYILIVWSQSYCNQINELLFTSILQLLIVLFYINAVQVLTNLMYVFCWIVDCPRKTHSKLVLALYIIKTENRITIYTVTYSYVVCEI